MQYLANSISRLTDIIHTSNKILCMSILLHINMVSFPWIQRMQKNKNKNKKRALTVSINALKKKNAYIEIWQGKGKGSKINWMTFQIFTCGQDRVKKQDMPFWNILGELFIYKLLREAKGLPLNTNHISREPIHLCQLHGFQTSHLPVFHCLHPGESKFYQF